jgi:hypothetical protein
MASDGGILSDLSPKLLRFERRRDRRLAWDRRLIISRRSAADFQPLHAETNKYPFVYLRAAVRSASVVAINPAERACTTALGEVIQSARFRPILVQGAVFHDGYLEMDPISFGIFSIE